MSQLAALNAAAADPHDPVAAATLRHSLSTSGSHVVARAAEIIGEYGLLDYQQQLVSAFGRFVRDGARVDPGCGAKISIAAALVSLEAPVADFFLAGTRLVQMEGSYGPPIDTAAQLRALCVSGLAMTGHDDTLLVVARLLTDTEPDTRIGAIRAVARCAQPGGLPLLWYKSLRGDPEMPVMLECFAVMLDLDPTRTLPHVAGFLAHETPELAETAALAIGQARPRGALDVLDATLGRQPNATLRRTILTAMAMLRSDEAVDRLLAMLEQATFVERRDIMAALELFRHDDRVWRRVERTLARING